MTSSSTSFGTVSILRTRRTFQSTDRTWSARITLVTPSAVQTGTSNEYPLDWRVAGQITHKLVFRLYAFGLTTSAGRCPDCARP